MYFRLVIIGIVASLLSAGTALAAEGIRDGLWEIISQPEIPGMGMKLPASTLKQCYTKEDAKNYKKFIAIDKDCSITNYKVSGNKITWSMKCTGENAGTASGETMFSSNNFASSMQMKSDGEVMTVKVKGRRIGHCP